MIVAVLGANGQLGSDIVRAAGATNGSCVAFALTRMDLDVCDFGAISSVLSKHKFDVLVNCTSYHKTDEVETHATEAFRINAHAVALMARACKSVGARFVHISTDYVFDGAKDRPYRETDPANPLNVYGASKLLGEQLAKREHGEDTLIARVASLFGVAGSSGKGGNFIETILKKAKETGEVRVVNDVIMSPTSTADVARTLLTLLAERAPAGTYHIVNSGQATWYEFARQAIELAGIPATVVATTQSQMPSIAARPSYSALDNTKACEIAGSLPSWQSALEKYLQEKGHKQSRLISAAGMGSWSAKRL
jgi:dTDP-4-dehydrorhamnose reductase